jgi:hypothetical protein
MRLLPVLVVLMTCCGRGAIADGPFRDTLTYDPAEGSWTLVIESSQPGGAWRHFARYDIRRN